MAQLSPDLVSLIHHVELNRSGWWERALQRIIMASLWFSGRNMTITEIAREIKTNHIGADVPLNQLASLVTPLVKSGMIIEVTAANFKISEKANVNFESDIDRIQAAENRSRDYYNELWSIHVSEDAVAGAWEDFLKRFLIPLIRTNGARVYQLLTKVGRPVSTKSLLTDFVADYPEGFRKGLRRVVESFIHTEDTAVREYVLRHVYACFCVEASSLKADTLKTLTDAAALRPTFTVFVDTNFVFSLLDMHSRPFKQAAESLLDVASRLTERATVEFRILPITVEEAKSVLMGVLKELSQMRITKQLAEAALATTDEGPHNWYFRECLKTGAFTDARAIFEPYTRNLVNILREKGIELYNNRLDSYLDRDDVKDDIEQQTAHQERRRLSSRKTEEQLKHDLVLWHFIRDQRPAYDESPLEAGFWIVTEDFRLLAFDASKSRQLGCSVPLCMHPSTFVQMLQFWIPRSPQLETALLSSVLLPVLSEEFNPEAERVTIDILRVLSRFENIEDLSVDTVIGFLVDKALRQRVRSESNEDRRVSLVKQALIEENRKIKNELRLSAEREKKLRCQVAQQYEETERQSKAIDELTSETRRRAKQICDDGQRIANESKERQHLEKAVESLEHVVQSLQKRDVVRRERFRFAAVFGVAIPVAITIASVLLALTTSYYWAWKWWRTAIVLASGMLILWTWRVGYAADELDSVQAWKPYNVFLKARKWLKSVLWLILIGVLANAVWHLLLPYVDQMMK